LSQYLKVNNHLLLMIDQTWSNLFRIAWLRSGGKQRKIGS